MIERTRIIIPGRPVTKKNSSRVVRRGKFTKVLPSEAFEAYEKIALAYIRKAMPGQFCEPVTMRCLYWMPDKRWWPDLVGLLQATSDIMEAAGVIENDRLIADYNGSRIVGLDQHNPRAEIEIQGLGIEYKTADPYVEKKRVQTLF